MTRIAWSGCPKISEESTACYPWIVIPTPCGCHLWTEETTRGPHWIRLAKKAPDALWLAHEKLLRDLAKLAGEREAGRS